MGQVGHCCSLSYPKKKLHMLHSSDERIDSNDEGWVYTLECDDGFWYVGWSMEPEVRIASHFLGRGCVFTKSHKPLRVTSLVQGCKKLENLTTVALMAQKGWQKVRGGSYLSQYMTVMPYPLQKAFSIRPAHTPELLEREEIEGNAVWYEFMEGKQHKKFRAMVSGPQALEACPKSAVKEFYGETEEELRAMVRTWLKTGDDYFVGDITKGEL